MDIDEYKDDFEVIEAIGDARKIIRDASTKLMETREGVHEGLTRIGYVVEPHTNGRWRVKSPMGDLLGPMEGRFYIYDDELAATRAALDHLRRDRLMTESLMEDIVAHGGSLTIYTAYGGTNFVDYHTESGGLIRMSDSKHNSIHTSLVRVWEMVNA